MNLNSGNCTVDKESGAVLVHKSPELLETMRLQKEVKEMNKKLDEILNLLKGGIISEQKVD